MGEDDFAPGLEGITVAETRLSDIDGEAGELTIAGFLIEELAPNATPAEIAHLLWEDRLPTAGELERIRSDLAAHRAIPDATRALVEEAGAAKRSAMDALRMGIASTGVDERVDDPRSQAEVVVARMAPIAARFWRARTDAGAVASHPDRRLAENYLWMLNDEEPSRAAVRGLETYLATVCDHGVNASTFTARVITSTESDVVSAITGAIGALKGPLHGGAPGPVLEMLESIRDEGDPEGYITDRLDAGERIMGFGHRVYEVRDPRAEVLERATERLSEDAEDGSMFAVARDVERAAVDILHDRYPDHHLDTNVEFYTAVLLHGVGIPKELFSATFAIGRAAGWTAHCLEQRDDNGLIRPLSRYVGPRGRTWQPVESR